MLSNVKKKGKSLLFTVSAKILQIFLQIFLHSTCTQQYCHIKFPLQIVRWNGEQNNYQPVSRIGNLTTLFTLLCNWCSCDKWELKSNHCLLKLCKSLSRKVSFTKNKPVNFIHLSGFSLQKRTFAFKKNRGNYCFLKNAA